MRDCQICGKFCIDDEDCLRNRLEKAEAERDKALLQIDELLKWARNLFETIEQDSASKISPPVQMAIDRFVPFIEKRKCLHCNDSGKIQVNGGLGFVACGECESK